MTSRTETDATVLIHVQHLLGTGHAVRAGRIAAAFAAAGHRTHLVTGGPPLETLSAGGARVHQLPPVRAADAAFSRLVTDTDGPVDEAVWDARRARLLSLAAEIAPDIVMTEQFPFGRRPFGAELLPLIEHLSGTEPAPLLLCSVRDVLVARAEKRNRETVSLLTRSYDGVLVHADPALLRLDDSFPLAAEIAPLLHYTGYVDNPGPGNGQVPSGVDADDIVVSSGGGAVGGPLCLNAAEAAAADPERRRWRILLGRDLPPSTADRVRQMVRSAGSRVIVEPARPDFRQILENAAVSVSQAGYNTAMDLIATGCRAVLVPFDAGKETEQSQRAAALERAGAARVVAQRDLSPEGLLRAIAEAVGAPKRRLDVSLDGAARSVDIATRLLEEKRTRLLEEKRTRLLEEKRVRGS